MVYSLLVFQSCQKDTLTEAEDHSENYKYYPQRDGNEWNYHMTMNDLVSGSVDTVTETGIYMADSARTFYYRNGNVRGYTTWTNSGNQLVCCGDKVLIDYRNLNCSGDSVSIYSSITGNANTEIFQYCQKETPPVAAPYDQVECLKTSQLTIFPDGTSLRIVSYFGHGIGWIYNRLLSFDKSGKPVFIETRKLVSHKVK